jgi:dihydrofolate reductase
MKAIVVVDEKWNIGKDGGLLVHLSGDLKYFKQRTLGKTIVIGRKTLESFPGSKPLPGRPPITSSGLPSRSKSTSWMQLPHLGASDLILAL